ncbi:leucine-rich repeat-containing protein 45-like isoform X2 [Sycon ciliatum]
MLKRNKSIKCLSLEWNSLGTDEDAFTLLMEGLAINSSVLELDLRNNHITHMGARQLAASLMQNKTVQEIDLSWNNCGLVGGRALLDCLEHNRTMVSLELTGNSVAEDVMSAVSLALQRNVDRHQLESTYSSRTQQLTEALDHEVGTKKKEISEMIDKLEWQKAAFDAALETSQQRIGDLQRELMLSREEISQLNARYLSTSTSLQVSEDKNHQSLAMIEQLRRETAEMHQAHQADIKSEKERFTVLRAEAAAAAQKATNVADALSAKVKELELSSRQLVGNIESLEQDNKQLRLHVQKVETSFQSQRLTDEKRHAAVLQDQQAQAQEELNRARHQANGREHALQEQLRQSEIKITQLEQELSRQKSSNLSSREVLLADHKAQLEQVKNEHKMNIHHLEERVQQLQMELDAKQSSIIQTSSTANQLQSKLTALTQESLAEQQSAQQHAKKLEKLADEQSQQAESVRRAKRDAQRRLEEALERCQQLEQDVLKQRAKTSDLETQHMAKLSSKDREVSTLSERVDGLQRQLQHQRDAELKRAGQLESALSAFVSSTKSANA